jgi:hypothetical protein
MNTYVIIFCIAAILMALVAVFYLNPMDNSREMFDKILHFVVVSACVVIVIYAMCISATGSV